MVELLTCAACYCLAACALLCAATQSYNWHFAECIQRLLIDCVLVLFPLRMAFVCVLHCSQKQPSGSSNTHTCILVRMRASKRIHPISHLAHHTPTRLQISTATCTTPHHTPVTLAYPCMNAWERGMSEPMTAPLSPDPCHTTVPVHRQCKASLMAS